MRVSSVKILATYNRGDKHSEATKTHYLWIHFNWENIQTSQHIKIPISNITTSILWNKVAIH